MIAPGSRYSLTLGDAFELVKQVPSGSVDLILTDPPYDSCFSAVGFGDRSNGFCRIGGAVGGAPSFDVLPVLEELPRICTPFNAYFFASRGQVPTYLEFAKEKGYRFDILMWAKDNPMPLTNGNFIGGEYVVVLREKGATFNTGLPLSNYLRYYLSYRYSGPSGHPTEKPRALLERFVRVSSRVGDVVFDPFAGSGSTGLVALKGGRRFIGFEINPEYYQWAAGALESASLETYRVQRTLEPVEE